MSLFGQESYSYHASIRRYTVLFGVLFSDLVLKRGDKWIKVPLRHGTGNLYEKLSHTVEEREQSRLREILPSMSFYMTNLERDSTRQIGQHNPLTLAEGYVTKSRVPYNFTFRLDVRNKNMDDHLQILEQIVTVFDPTVTVKFEPLEQFQDTAISENVVIRLETTEVEDDDTDQEEARRIEASYLFTLNGYLYKKVNQVAVVKEVVFGTGTGPDDLNKSLFVHDAERTTAFNDLEALESLIEGGLVETVLTNPDNAKEIGRPKATRRKRIK